MSCCTRTLHDLNQHLLCTKVSCLYMERKKIKTCWMSEFWANVRCLDLVESKCNGRKKLRLESKWKSLKKISREHRRKNSLQNILAFKYSLQSLSQFKWLDLCFSFLVDLIFVIIKLIRLITVAIRKITFQEELCSMTLVRHFDFTNRLSFGSEFQLDLSVWWDCSCFANLTRERKIQLDSAHF